MDRVYLVQGYMLIGPRTAAGKPGRQWWAGNVAEAVLTLSEDNVHKSETFDGLMTTPVLQPGHVAGRLTGAFDEWSTDGLALGLYSTTASTPGGTVSAEALPAGLQRGDVFSLAQPYATGVTFRSAGGGALPLSAFRRFGHNSRAYQVVADVSGYPQPFTASYTHVGHERHEVFTGQPADAYVVLDGINAVTREPVLFDIYLARFDPFEGMGLIDTRASTLPFAADVIVDALNLEADGSGGIFSMRRRPAA